MELTTACVTIVCVIIFIMLLLVVRLCQVYGAAKEFQLIVKIKNERISELTNKLNYADSDICSLTRRAEKLEKQLDEHKRLNKDLAKRLADMGYNIQEKTK